MPQMLASIVIRTLNEARYLGELLRSISSQDLAKGQYEVIIVDSGSIDDTLIIAAKHKCRVVHIAKEEFTFGRSLNMGCEAANGEILVFISGHCVPASISWLTDLISPLTKRKAAYSYGRQLGRDTSKFSETQVFRKYFPEKSQIPQEGFFCNNANAALLRSAWAPIRFDEQLTGLEDLCMAKELAKHGHKVAYVAEAAVFHIHNESWRQVRLRYEREALALREIMPEIHVSFLNFLRYVTAGVISDIKNALIQRQLIAQLQGIVLFRLMQFWGTYRGNQEHRSISIRKREEYFYPTNSKRDNIEKEPLNCPTSTKSP